MYEALYVGIPYGIRHTFQIRLSQPTLSLHPPPYYGKVVSISVPASPEMTRNASTPRKDRETGLWSTSSSEWLGGVCPPIELICPFYGIVQRCVFGDASVTASSSDPPALSRPRMPQSHHEHQDEHDQVNGGGKIPPVLASPLPPRCSFHQEPRKSASIANSTKFSFDLHEMRTAQAASLMLTHARELQCNSAQRAIPVERPSLSIDSRWEREGE